MKHLSLIIGLAIFAFSAIFAITVMGTDLNLQFASSAESIRIKHNSAVLLPKEDLTITFADVLGVDFYETLPAIRKVNGLDNTKVRIGAFKNDAIGEFRAYLYLKSQGYLVLTTQGGTYMISPPNAKALYQQIQDHISNR